MTEARFREKEDTRQLAVGDPPMDTDDKVGPDVVLMRERNSCTHELLSQMAHGPTISRPV